MIAQTVASLQPAAVPQAGPAGRLWSIGQVLQKLQEEFPDLSPSKLRFLEDQQLVAPARTEKGYRKFSESDVDRVKLVLEMQRDHYLPLRVIREYLAELDAGSQPVWPGSTGPAQSRASRRFDRAGLAVAAGADGALVDAAIDAGMLPDDDEYGEDAVETLRALAQLAQQGLEPRHLRGVRTAVDREVGLIETALATLRHKPDGRSRARADELAIEMAAAVAIVRTSLVRSRLTGRDA